MHPPPPGYTFCQVTLFIRHGTHSFIESGTGASVYRLSWALDTLNIFLLLYTEPKLLPAWIRASCSMAPSSGRLKVCVQPCRQQHHELRPSSSVGKIYVLLSLCVTDHLLTFLTNYLHKGALTQGGSAVVFAHMLYLDSYSSSTTQTEAARHSSISFRTMKLTTVKGECKIKKYYRNRSFRCFTSLPGLMLFFPTHSTASTLPLVHRSFRAQSIFWLLHFKR